jgi:hypothetical protein
MAHDWLAERGAWVTVGRDGKRDVEGWLIGQISEGLLIAADDELEDVRVVSDFDSIQVAADKRLPGISAKALRRTREKLRRADSAVSADLRKAISLIRFDRLHQFGHRSAELVRAIHRATYLHTHQRPRRSSQEDSRPLREDMQTGRVDLINFMLAQGDRSADLHREVFETLNESGLTKVLDEHGPELARLPPEFTIPAYDLDFVSRKELTSALKATRKERWTARKHSAALEAAEDTRSRLLLEGAGYRNQPERVDDATSLSRWVGPSLRVLSGTGLAVANVAVGLTAGLTGSVFTIGATAVPTYVGVATSIYTGLAQVADGLEKIGRRK